MSTRRSRPPPSQGRSGPRPAGSPHQRSAGSSHQRGESQQRRADARRCAAAVLRRVWDDDAFAAAALSAELERHPELDPRDRALATELVYGVLRTEGYLHERLSRHGRMRRADSELMGHLLVAAYQLAFLDRVPQRAAVHEAVGQVRRVRGARVAGFANAVLRKLAAEPSSRLGEAVSSSAPGWLVEGLRSAVGEEEAAALLGVDGRPSGVGLRGSATRPLPDWLRNQEGAIASERTPGAFRYVGGGDPRKLPGFQEGAFTVQEEGAQLVTWALGARPGERVLDACAGRGQKTSLLIERLGAEGEVWATDLYAAKLGQLQEELRRLGLRTTPTAVVDWTAQDGAPPELPHDFDRVLVDAPCVGDGTLRRRPEIARRLHAGDPARFTEVQEAIVRAAASRVRPGGRVLYATCSVLRQACEEVVARVSDQLVPVGFDAPEVAATFPAHESTLRLLPLRHGTDGYFVASLVRR